MPARAATSLASGNPTIVHPRQRTDIPCLASAPRLACLARPSRRYSYSPRSAFPAYGTSSGAVLAVLAAATQGGLRRWQQVDRAMRRGMPLPVTHAELSGSWTRRARRPGAGL